MQTILGAGGAIGKELALSLKNYTGHIRLVSRNPSKINDNDELFPGDLLDPEAVDVAVSGSEVVYLTAGLEYKLKVWESSWPRIMQNVIDACQNHKARLVFFDNVYMYGADQLSHMTEISKIDPPSKKGKVRAKIADMLMTASKERKIEGLIARSADFYGPSIQNVSMLTETVFKNFSEGKKANWLGGLNHPHSLTYVPDAGKATALLGNTDQAYNQVWHLPTASNPMTGKELINSIAELMQVKPRVQAAPKFMVRILGLFIPIMKEMVEMMYQYDRPYIFDSIKFENKFGIKPTPYADGLKTIVETDYK